MDYEKKYKKAIERARIWKDKSGMPKYKQGILDDIFPELKESDDEIIRKELIAIFKGKIPYTSEEDAKRYIAWLEKQGVQKPQRMISAEAKEAMYDKPAWSEEDERILNGLISSLVRIGANTRTDSTSINYTFSKEINWLKSLKEKMKKE